MYFIFIFCSSTFKVVKLLRWIEESYLIRCCWTLLYLFEVPFFVSFISFYFYFINFFRRRVVKKRILSLHIPVTSVVITQLKSSTIFSNINQLYPQMLYTPRMRKLLWPIIHLHSLIITNSLGMKLISMTQR